MQDKTTTPYYDKFIQTLPKDLPSLKGLYSWYEQHCSAVLQLLNSNATIDSVKYDLQPEDSFPIAILKSITFRIPFAVSLIKSFLADYSARMCAEKMMLETYIADIELLERQRKYN